MTHYEGPSYEGPESLELYLSWLLHNCVPDAAGRRPHVSPHVVHTVHTPQRHIRFIHFKPLFHTKFLSEVWNRFSQVCADEGHHEAHHEGPWQAGKFYAMLG